MDLNVQPRIVPELDPTYVPAVLWNRAYRAKVESTPGALSLGIALTRTDGVCFRYDTRILPHEGANIALNIKYIERILKFLLWQKGGSRFLIAGCPALAAELGRIYSKEGARAFDHETVGRRVFLDDMSVKAVEFAELPAAREMEIPLGRHLDGCRIGFDLGGSDRKAAALIDGKVVYSEEIRWDPYFQSDPNYHIEGIRDSLKKAAAHLPRVDAIGGSAAGDYVNNEPRVASLFRGIKDPAVFDQYIRPIFRKLKEEFGGVPFEVANDGEVTALSGSMSLKDNAVLGISMGTSVAAGYCDEKGHITIWLNELAFAPVDYRPDAPADEWSGDIGCAVQYFCQQGVARLAPKAGIDLPADMPLADRLVEVQKLMAANDPRARKLYETIGVCFGYAIAHYAEFYTIRNLLILGRVTSGQGGEIIIEKARHVLDVEFPALAKNIRLCTPDEKDKRHGQAIAAASLPELKSK